MSPPREGPSLGLDQRVDARFGDEHVLAVHLQHHKPILVQGNQAPLLALRLSSSVSAGHQVCSTRHDRPPPSLAHRAAARLTEGAAWVECVCQSSVYRAGMT
jgi:hypothetical protein